MKRLSAVLIVLAIAIGQPLAAANLDLVVMVDTSESMFPYFDDLVNYLIQDLLKEKLHRGDTFHLLSFASLPEVEVSFSWETEQDAERAFGRILLLHPLGRYTDLVAAVQFLSTYVRELPETKPKRIILLTDGVHDPPPGSPNKGGPEVVRKAIEDATESMRRPDWEFSIIRVPPEPAEALTELPSYLPDISNALDVPVVPYQEGERESLAGRTTGFPTLEFPGYLGKVGTRFMARFVVRNYRDEPVIIKLTSIQSDGSELLSRRVSLTVPANGRGILEAPIKLPISFPEGERTIPILLVFGDDARVSPSTGFLHFEHTGKGGIALPRLSFLYVIYIVVGAGAIYLIVLLFLSMRRKLHEVSFGQAESGYGTAGRTGEPGRDVGRGAGVRAGAEEERLGASKRAIASGKVALAARMRAHANIGDRAGISAQAGSRVAAGLGTTRTAGGAAAPRSEAGVSAGAAASRATLFSAGRGAGARGRIPLLSVQTARPLDAAPVRAKVRATVESIHRALPQPRIQQSAGLPPRIEMRIRRQNPQIGFRNVHRIAPGSTRSVGGGFSAFLVFIVPTPRAIGYIRNEAGRYVFTPSRLDLFPTLNGPVNNCLETDIPFATPRGQALSLRFRKWVSPLDEINALMRSVKRTG